MKLLMDDADMDAQLQRTIAVIPSGSADPGEAMATAARIEEGNYDSWFDEWAATAEAAAAAGRRSHDDGHTVSARKAYLRATEYWRQAFFFVRHDLDDERLQRAWRQHRACFRAAVPMFDGDSIIDEIPFDGASMTAYLFRPATDGGLRPTVIAPPGFDSTAEAGYAATGCMALDHGYNVLLFDGPGQGGMLYEHRYAMRPDYEKPFAAAFSWLLDQVGVDPDAVVLVGRSLGGYLAPRAAAFEPRLRAVVADPAQVEFASRMRAMFPGDQWQRLVDGDPAIDAELEGLLDGPRNIEWYGARQVTLGGTSVGDFLRKQLAFNLEGLVDRIRMPVLLTQGEGDFAAQGEALYSQLPGDKELKQFTEAEGAGGHCEGLGSTLWEQYVFDWLDDVLGRAD